MYKTFFFIKKLVKIIVVISTLIVILLITLVNLVIGYLFTPGELNQEKILVIESDISLKKIINKLSDQKIIKYPNIFFFSTKLLLTRNSNFKSGEYIFYPHSTALQVLIILKEGKSILHKLTVVEGETVFNILNKIKKENLLIGEITSEVTEGSLMPDTYFYSYGENKEQIVKKMHQAMCHLLDSFVKQLPSHLPIKSKIEILTLASIIEKETHLDSERPIIAAVFLNRLKKGMKLQADPTVIYSITKGKFKFNRALSKKDLLTPSPYNTYYSYGLPPSPISCPSFKSLEAVIHPAKTDVLYFVSNGRKGHNFSNTLIGHNRNIRMKQ